MKCILGLASLLWVSALWPLPAYFDEQARLAKVQVHAVQAQTTGFEQGSVTLAQQIRRQIEPNTTPLIQATQVSHALAANAIARPYTDSHLDNELDWPLTDIEMYFCVVLILMTLQLYRSHSRLNNAVAKCKWAEKRVAHLNIYDDLTTLPNRRLLNDRLSQAVLFHGRELSSFVVLFIDITYLKALVKQLGPDLGDTLVLRVAKVLRQSIRKSDTLARFSSNEFVVILNRIDDRNTAAQIAQTILTKLATHPQDSATHMSIGACIGIARYPADGDNLIDLLQRADEFMSKAKSSGGSCYKSSY